MEQAQSAGSLAVSHLQSRSSVGQTSKTRWLILDEAPELGSGGLHCVRDPEEDFDAIICTSTDPVGLDSLLAGILPRCSNPAAPIIVTSSHLGPRADVVLRDLSAQSIERAVHAAHTISARLAKLPAIQRGVDRNRLLALTLAFTRDVALEAHWSPHATMMVGYPLLAGIPSQRAMLEELATEGLVRRRFFDRLFVCGRCNSSRLMAREVCTKCHSSHVVDHALLHHHHCGFQGPEHRFRTEDGGYQCPKCTRHLRHYCLDYDNPGHVVECQSCHDVMAEPEAFLVCVDCQHNQPSDGAMRQSWHHYELTPDGIAAVQSGVLPKRDSVVEGKRRHSLREFCVLARTLLSLAGEHGRKITALRMKIDAAALESSAAPQYVAQSCLFAQEIATQCLGESDIVAAVPNGIVALLPEADVDTVRNVADLICDAIEGAIKLKLSPQMDIVGDPADIAALIEELR